MTAAERVREAQSAISVAGKVLGAAVSGKPAEGTDAAAAAQGARVAFRILREICGESQGAKIVGAVISIVIKCLLVDMVRVSCE
jgi:hypothetical protein